MRRTSLVTGATEGIGRAVAHALAARGDRVFLVGRNQDRGEAVRRVANPGIYKDTLDLEDLQFRRGEAGLDVSARTQFANDLLATELAERLRGTRVEATAVWPGVTRTNVFRNAKGLPLPLRALAPIAMAVLGHFAETAADTIVHLDSAPEAIGAGGRFFGPKRRERAIPPRALHADRRLGSWKASEALVSPYL